MYEWTPTLNYFAPPQLTPPPYEDAPPPLSTSTSSSSSTTGSPRKGSIASLLNSINELQQLDQEEQSTNYLTHFTCEEPVSPPQHKKGLRLFSQHVCDILQQRGRVTYNELVQQLMDELEPSVGSDPKNIRRRVYDALNVLMAIQFITKDKKEIQWLGDDLTVEEDLEREEQRYLELTKRIDMQRKEIQTQKYDLTHQVTFAT
ncbi:E2F/DP family winged-helix DNA-binding domain-containing protein [Chlamydoabsidia padenii]|nr:E2F/DP family winged-helix DNA-binding domain-containing protein [Chlamydoabsidia padenii]